METVNDQLKNIYQIERSRHRCVANFLVNLVAGLIAYTYQENVCWMPLRLACILSMLASVQRAVLNDLQPSPERGKMR